LTLTKDPEKKIPSTAANAINLSAKVLRRSEIHFKAQSAFLAMQGTGTGSTRMSDSSDRNTSLNNLLVSMASKR
jgi:hypothetical protein